MQNFERRLNGKNLVLGLQHLIAMFGATVLVPLLTGFDPTVALLAAGIGTLIFHSVTKFKVPVFLGSSFAFIPVINQVKELHGGDLAYAQGGIVIAGLIYVIFSFAINKIGVDKIRKLLPAQVIGPMIMVIGLTLVPVALGNASKNYILAGIAFSTAVLITLFAKGMIKQLGILIAVIVGYAAAFATGNVELTAIAKADFLAIPAVTLPKFSLDGILIIAPIVLTVFMEHIGDVTTNSSVCHQDFVKDPGLNRTLLGDGLATMFAGFIGGPANTTYGENTAVLALTKNYNPFVLEIAAVAAILLSMVGKFGAALTTIPVSVMGGISVMLFGMIALVGVRLVKNEKVAFNWKNIVVMASILIIGVGTPYINDWFGIRIAIPITSTIFLEKLSLAAVVGISLNALLSQIGKEDSVKTMKATA